MKVRNPLYLHLWFSDQKRTKIREWDIRSLDVGPGREYVLITLHNSYLTSMGGIEKETFELVRWMVRRFPDVGIIVYFYDVNEKKYVLHHVLRGRMQHAWELSDTADGERVLRSIVQSCKVKLALLEHLQWHSLRYIPILKAHRTETVLFLHDFYYYCPYKYMPLPSSSTRKEVECNLFSKDAICDDCAYGNLFPNIAISDWRHEMKRILSDKDITFICSSEYVELKYRELYSLSDMNNYIVSYPNFVSRIS